MNGGMAPGEIMTNAQLRIEVADLKKELREVKIERDQARGGIEATLEETGYPSLSTLVIWMKHYQENDKLYRELVEKLEPHLSRLPQELALELKAAFGKSPDKV